MVLKKSIIKRILNKYDPETTFGQIIILFIDKIIFGAIIALAFLWYDSLSFQRDKDFQEITRKENQDFQLMLWNQNYEHQKQLDKMKEVIDNIYLKKELLPVILNKNTDINIRILSLESLLQRKGVSFNFACVLADKLFYETTDSKKNFLNLTYREELVEALVKLYQPNSHLSLEMCFQMFKKHRFETGFDLWPHVIVGLLKDDKVLNALSGKKEPYKYIYKNYDFLDEILKDYADDMPVYYYRNYNKLLNAKYRYWRYFFAHNLLSNIDSADFDYSIHDNEYSLWQTAIDAAYNDSKILIEESKNNSERSYLLRTAWNHLSSINRLKAISNNDKHLIFPSDTDALIKNLKNMAQ
jgi:hypothetical protein